MQNGSVKTAGDWIKELELKASTKYPGKYDCAKVIGIKYDLSEIPLEFGIVKGLVVGSSRSGLLKNMPREVEGFFDFKTTGLNTLEGLPKTIKSIFFWQSNPFENLNGLLETEITNCIHFFHSEEVELRYWVQAMFNTNLCALEYHYDYHKYKFPYNKKLEEYVYHNLAEIIKYKRLKSDLGLK